MGTMRAIEWHCCCRAHPPAWAASPKIIAPFECSCLHFILFPACKHSTTGLGCMCGRCVLRVCMPVCVLVYMYIGLPAQCILCPTAFSHFPLKHTCRARFCLGGLLGHLRHPVTGQGRELLPDEPFIRFLKRNAYSEECEHHAIKKYKKSRFFCSAGTSHVQDLHMLSVKPQRIVSSASH